MPINGLSDFEIIDGFLKTHIVGTDPYMISPKNLSSETFRYSSIVIRMKLRYGKQAEFFWTATGQSDFMAGFEMPFALKPDGEFHACQVPVGESRHWAETVTRLRLNPGGKGSAEAIANRGRVVIDLRYQKNKSSKLLYRKQAYILTSDLNTSEETILQYYFLRWDSEVNHRDEKTIFELGDAQVCSVKSVDRNPQGFLKTTHSKIREQWCN